LVGCGGGAALLLLIMLIWGMVSCCCSRKTSENRIQVANDEGGTSDKSLDAKQLEKKPTLKAKPVVENVQEFSVYQNSKNPKLTDVVPRIPKKTSRQRQKPEMIMM